MKCLIAEDDPTSRKILKHYMSAHAECDDVVDGQAAVEAFAAALEAGQPYDVVCLDIMMPRMDGRAALEAIRRLEEERSIPVGRGARVIMATCLDDAGNVVGSFRTGANSYLVKPIGKQDVATALTKAGLMPATAPETLEL